LSKDQFTGTVKKEDQFTGLIIDRIWSKTELPDDYHILQRTDAIWSTYL